jgi:hypothetical protein
VEGLGARHPRATVDSQSKSRTRTTTRRIALCREQILLVVVVARRGPRRCCGPLLLCGVNRSAHAITALKRGQRNDTGSDNKDGSWSKKQISRVRGFSNRR